VRRLVDDDAAAFLVPGTAPRVGAVVGFVAPAQDDDLAQEGGADLAAVYGALDADAGGVPAALADHAEGAVGGAGRGDHGVAVGHPERHRLFDEDVEAGGQALDRLRGVEGVGRGDHDGLGAVALRHLGGGGTRLDSPAAGECRRLFGIAPADRYEGGATARGDRPGVELGDFAVAVEPEL
jgi:hypothetical protein